MILRQPLPLECRDTITGNAFFHGCVEELTWFLEDKSGWVAGLAMALALLHVINDHKQYELLYFICPLLILGNTRRFEYCIGSSS